MDRQRNKIRDKLSSSAKYWWICVEKRDKFHVSGTEIFSIMGL